MRAFIGSLGALVGVYAWMTLPLGNVATILQSYVIFTGIFGSIIFNEPFTKPKILATIFCFTGVIIIFKPEFLFGTDINYKISYFEMCVYLSFPLILSVVTLLLRGLSRKAGAFLITNYFACGVIIS